MATFPRTLMPQKVTLPAVPTGLVSVGETGAVQLRNTQAVGRMWTETWPPLRAGDPDTEALIAWIEWAYNTQEVFDVTHVLIPGSGLSPNGAGGGSPVVSGSSQTGETLNTSGWSTGVTNVVRAGDVISIAGINVVYRIIQDANSDGSGNATLTINPPIPEGSSPANSAAITRSGVTFNCYIAEPPDLPEALPDQYYAGLAVTFRESP